MTKMSDGDLAAILEAKIHNALGYQGGRLSQLRRQAERYYKGESFGNEIDGRSQVVSRDVAEAVDSMMPSLMRIFASGDQVVRFNPSGPQDEAIADQATDYVNWIWNQQNEGFANFYSWFKDALLKKTGTIKIWWDESEDTTRETYQGLTDSRWSSTTNTWTLRTQDPRRWPCRKTLRATRRKPHRSRSCTTSPYGGRSATGACG